MDASPFAKLPQELCDSIFEYTLIDDEPISVWTLKDALRPSPARAYPTGLLQTCRAMRSLDHIFYSRNTFLIGDTWTHKALVANDAPVKIHAPKDAIWTCQAPLHSAGLLGTMRTLPQVSCATNSPLLEKTWRRSAPNDAERFFAALSPTHVTQIRQMTVDIGIMDTQSGSLIWCSNAYDRMRELQRLHPSCQIRFEATLTAPPNVCSDERLSVQLSIDFWDLDGSWDTSLALVESRLEALPAHDSKSQYLNHAVRMMRRMRQRALTIPPQLPPMPVLSTYQKLYRSLRSYYDNAVFICRILVIAAFQLVGLGSLVEFKLW